MKKSLLASAVAAIAALAAVGGAGLASATTVAQSDPYSFITTDGGTCGNTWANDLGNRTYTQPAADPAGNYTVAEKFTNGHFSTNKGKSPGACDAGVVTTRKVVEGLNGKWYGDEQLFIDEHGSAVVFNPQDGSCAGHDTIGDPFPCTNTSYVAYHYGIGATFTITAYTFNYHTGDHRALGTKNWHEQSSASGEIDSGDIYTSAV